MSCRACSVGGRALGSEKNCCKSAEVRVFLDCRSVWWLEVDGPLYRA